jgi:hypothetical protein
VRDGEKTRARELIFACIITPHLALVGQTKAGHPTCQYSESGQDEMSTV